MSSPEAAPPAALAVLAEATSLSPAEAHGAELQLVVVGALLATFLLATILLHVPNPHGTHTSQSATCR